MVIIYGAYSDEMGRKLTILIPFVGGVFWAVSACLMINLDLPIYVYYIGSIINGFSGSYGTMLSGAFAYLADTTTKKQRTLAIGMLEASLGISVVISNFVVGYWLKTSGPEIPSIAISCLLCMSVIFMFCVKESVVRSQNSPLIETGIVRSLRRQLKKVVSVFIANRQRGISLALCVSSFSLHIFCALGGMSLLTLYALNEPLCWTSDVIGIYSGSTSVVWQVGMFLALLLFRRRLSDWCMAYMAFTSFICYNSFVSASSAFDSPANNAIMYTGE